jgi:hypothetical protein
MRPIELQDKVIKNFGKVIVSNDNNEFNNNKIFYYKQALNKGIIIDNRVLNEFEDEKELESVIDSIVFYKGFDFEKLNNTFFESWKTVRDTSEVELKLQQLLHYLTTYGFQELGIYSSKTIYIPEGDRETPELGNPSNLVFVGGITVDELKTELSNLIKRDIALKSEFVEDLFIIIQEIFNFKQIKEMINNIKNRELKLRLRVLVNDYGDDPEEFIRTVIFLKTGVTNVVKNEALEREIVDSMISVKTLFERYIETHGIEKLASIFNRYKNIFLALKASEQGDFKRLINRISKKSKKHHKPALEDFYMTIVDKILKNQISLDRLEYYILPNMKPERKIKLFNNLLNRLDNPEYMIYNVRNGKMYVKESVKQTGNKFRNKNFIEKFYDSIYNDLSIKGKRVFIPAGVEYALPTSEKNFVGDMPAGSRIVVDKDIVFGIHWSDTDRTIDLDLSVISDRKFGWDAQFSNENELLFSGDMTAAPDGATELFYINKRHVDDYIVNLNFFNHYDDDEEVDYDLIIAREKVALLEKNYMVDPDNIVYKGKFSIGTKSRNIGLVSCDDESNTFIFVDGVLSNANVSKRDETTINARKAMISRYKNYCTLNDILYYKEMLVEDVDDAEVDFSFNKIDKNTFIELLS